MVGTVLSVRFLFLLFLVLADIFLPFVICLDGGGGGCGEGVGGFGVEFRKSMLVTLDGGAEVVVFIV